MNIFHKHIKSIILTVVLTFGLILGSSCASNSYKLKPVNFNSDVVIMYSTSWCNFCSKAKRFLNDNHITYIELDYENEKEFRRLLKFAAEIGYRGIFDSVPVFVVRGKILVGYDPDVILMILGTSQ